MARSILTLLTVSSILSSAFALPLDTRNPRPNISIVNVDGSSDPTYTAPQVVTQTVATTVVATVNVDHDTATETVWVTTAPTPPPMPKWTIPCNSSSSSTASSSISSIAWPTLCNTTSTTSSTLSTSSIAWPTPCNTTSSTTSSIPSASATPTLCDDDNVVGDGAPFHTRYPIPTSAWGTGIAHPIHPSDGLAPRPSGMTAPLPTLPPNEAPYWFNETQVPNYRKRVIINE